MNTKLIAGLSLLLLTLSACAAAPAPQSNNEVTTMSNAERYRAAVNSQAKAKNIDVHWVNPPDEDDLDEYTNEPAKNLNGGADTR